MQGKIRWKRADYIRLGRAVAQFNKKVNELRTLENESYFPEVIEYTSQKENIKTRAELNRVINSLRRFSRVGAEELYTTEAGIQMTKWERKELGIASRVAQRKLAPRIKELTTAVEGTKYSRAQMGSNEFKKLQKTIERYKSIETKPKAEFESLRRNLLLVSKSDYAYNKALIWKQNYINTMKKYSHLDNYKILEEKMNSISNPLQFYEFFSANELTEDLTYQSDNTYSQEGFNSFLEQLGFEDLEDTISIGGE